MKKELIGQIFGRLIVIEDVYIKINGKNKLRRKCKCICGKEIITNTDKLISGHTKSCGCINRENGKILAKKMNKAWTKYSPIEASARRVHKGRYDDMSFNEFYDMSQLNCFYCNAAPNNNANWARNDKKASLTSKDNANFIYNGIDRIDSSLGHIKGNCVPACKFCNYSKSNMTLDEFKSFIKRLYIGLYGDIK